MGEFNLQPGEWKLTLIFGDPLAEDRKFLLQFNLECFCHDYVTALRKIIDGHFYIFLRQLMDQNRFYYFPLTTG